MLNAKAHYFAELKDKLVKIGPVIQSNTAGLDVLRRGVNGTKLGEMS